MKARAVVVFGIALSGFSGGCDRLGGLAVDMSMPSVGRVKTHEFRVWRRDFYYIAVGVEPVAVDDAACHAALQRSCKALVPPLGAIDWVLTQSGKIIASGAAPAQSWEWPADYPQRPIHWRILDRTVIEAGSHYVLEVSVQPAPIPVNTYQAHLRLNAPWKP